MDARLLICDQEKMSALLDIKAEGEARKQRLVTIGSIIFLIPSICIFVAVLSGIATFVLGMGNWTVRGVPIAVVFAYATGASVITMLVFYALVYPVCTILRTSWPKKAFDLMFAKGIMDTKDLLFAMKQLKRFRLSAVASIVVVGVSSIAFHDGMMDAIGNPLADILSVVFISIVGNVFPALMMTLLVAKHEHENKDVSTVFSSLVLSRQKTVGR